MMKESAGILPFRRREDTIEVLLLHLAGPLWRNKDKWHFAKGELDEGEDHLTAAKREYLEEVGTPVPAGELIDLGSAKTAHKTNYIWAIDADVDLSEFSKTIETNVFSMEWPPRSGRQQSFPENDRAEWFTIETARTKLFVGLIPFLDRLIEHIGIDDSKPPEQ